MIFGDEYVPFQGIEMYGFGNWAEVAEHVGTKSKPQCIDHYNAIYMSSPCFPLPVGLTCAYPNTCINAFVRDIIYIKTIML